MRDVPSAAEETASSRRTWSSVGRVAFEQESIPFQMVAPPGHRRKSRCWKTKRLERRSFGRQYQPRAFRLKSRRDRGGGHGLNYLSHYRTEARTSLEAWL